MEEQGSNPKRRIASKQKIKRSITNIQYLDKHLKIQSLKMPSDVRRRSFVELGDDTLPRVMMSLAECDIILVQGNKLNPVCVFQGLYNYPPLAQQTSHVALYIGHGKVCHAMPDNISLLRSTMNKPLKGGVGGVGLEDLTIFTGRKIAIARAAELAPSDIKFIIEKIKALRGSEFDYNQILTCISAALGKISGNPHAKFLEESLAEQSRAMALCRDTFFCSDLIFSCFDQLAYFKEGKFRGASANPLNCPQGLRSPVFLPADLFVNPNLHDIVV